MRLATKVTEQAHEGRCSSWLLHNGRGGVSRNRVASALRDLGIPEQPPRSGWRFHLQPSAENCSQD